MAFLTKFSRSTCLVKLKEKLSNEALLVMVYEECYSKVHVVRKFRVLLGKRHRVNQDTRAKKLVAKNSECTGRQMQKS